MDNNYSAPRRVSVLTPAVLQVIASLLLALSARTGFLHFGVFLVAVASAMFALQSVISKTYVYFASAALSVCGAFLIGGFFPCAMSAFAVPVGLIMASMIKKKSTKISVAATLEVIYIFLFAATFLAAYLIDGGELSASAIGSYFNDIIDVIKNVFIKNIETDEEMIVYMMRVLGADSTEVLKQMIDMAFETFKLILPAMLISIMGIIAYLTASFFKLGTRISNCELVLPDPKWETLPSKASAFIYSTAYILYSAAAIFSSEMNAFLLACYSVVIILSPLMMLMGLKWVLRLRNKGTVITLFVFGTMFMASLAAIILAFFGASEVFRRRDAEKKDEIENEHEN